MRPTERITVRNDVSHLDGDLFLTESCSWWVRGFQAQAEKQIPPTSVSLGVGMTTIKYC